MEPYHWRAYLLLVDIVAFSERTAADQVRFVEHLLGVFDAHVLARQDPSEEGRAWYFNSTGDGFLFAVSTAGSADLPACLCELAAELVARAGEVEDQEGRPLQVRAGLHRGDVSTLVREGGRRQAVGHGLNWVARIAAAAAADQVVASEAFVREVEDRMGRHPRAPVFLGREQEDGTVRPFRVQVKHGHMAELRVLADHGHLRPPRALARIQQIGDHLAQALRLVGESTLSALATEGTTPAQRARQLRPRLTLWVPEDGELRPIPPRVELPLRKRRVPLGRTRWALPAGNEAPAGPIARAFATGRSVALHGLPDPEDDEEAYLAAWLAHGVPAGVVDRFSRHARTLLAVPLGLFEEPAGVLCVDLLEPLAAQEELIQALLDTIRLRSSYFLAALLHLRRGG